MSVSVQQRQRVRRAADFRCGYCLTQEVVSGIPLTIEHIIPKAQGGTDADENLWLSCRLCNEAKGIQTEAIDPLTKNTVPLFNPRTQNWPDQFAWNEEGIYMIGKSASGRATIEALSLNTEFRIRARKLWVEVGWHPPL